MMELKAGYKQTEVGIIPEDWIVSSVGESFEVCNQFRLPISRSIRERMAGDYPYYGPTSIQGWLNEYRVEGEYALIGEDGDHFLKWQDQSMTLLVSSKFNVNNHAHLVKGTKNLTQWFYWFFSNRDITQFLTRQGAGRYKLTKTALLQIPCILPPTKTEQTAIATALSDVDALINALDKLIAKKRLIKQGAMQELLTGKKRLAGFSDEWEVKKLGDVSEVIGGGTPSTFNTEYWNGNINWFTPTEVGNGKYLFESLRKITKEGLLNCSARILPIGTILLTTRAGIGDVGILKKEACTNQGFQSLVAKNNYFNEFIYYLLLTLKNTLLQNASGSTFLEISPNKIKQIEVFIPDFEEQTAIAQILSDMDNEIEAIEKRRDKTLQIKQGMMQELLTGKTRLI